MSALSDRQRALVAVLTRDQAGQEALRYLLEICGYGKTVFRAGSDAAENAFLLGRQDVANHLVQLINTQEVDQDDSGSGR